MNVNQEQQSGEVDYSDAAIDREPILSHRAVHRIGWVVVALLVVVLLTVLPPLLNVSRYQRRVAQAISASIGRPVHFDAVHLHLLPLPGLTIQNFVVDEDPSFGSEPAMRANVVEARLRLASLWRRRVEVSHISLQSPSINLVRRADGRWSLQSVITEAGHLQNAPTAQGRAGSTPRFPYIEATEARINIKQGENKLPWSLLDARLALWLPDQNEWRVRLRGRPLRTDTDVSDVGELELEGSLGRGPATSAGGSPAGVTDQPLAISAKWSSTPLGEAAKLFLGQDTGFRGAASAELELRGTPAHLQISTDLHLHNLRRAEFVPRLPMSVDAHCQAEATGIVHALHNVRCAIPTSQQSAGLFDGMFRSRGDQQKAAPDIFLLQADVPDLTAPASATASLDLQRGSPGYFLNWLRVLSSRIPEAETLDGDVTLHADTGTDGAGPSFHAACDCSAPSPKGLTALAEQGWRVELNNASGPDTTPAGPGQPLGAERILISAGPTANAPQRDGEQEPPRKSTALESAPGTVVGDLSRAGLHLQYGSEALARYAARLLPPLGDNLPSPAAGPSPAAEAQTPVASERLWGQPQTWTIAVTKAPAPRKHRR